MPAPAVEIDGSIRTPHRRLIGVWCCLAVLCLAVLSGCREAPAPPRLQTMHFEIDDARLGLPVSATDAGVRFRPPIRWEPLSDAALDSVSRALAGTGPDLALRPRYIFLDKATGCVLSVATVDLPDSLSFEEQIAGYGAALAARFPADTVRQAQFLKDGIHVAQFLLQPGGRVTFKLLMATPIGEVLQFDYIVPQTSYAAQVRAIESSIGSIQWIE